MKLSALFVNSIALPQRKVGTCYLAIMLFQWSNIQIILPIENPESLISPAVGNDCSLAGHFEHRNLCGIELVSLAVRNTKRMGKKRNAICCRFLHSTFNLICTLIFVTICVLILVFAIICRDIAINSLISQQRFIQVLSFEFMSSG